MLQHGLYPEVDVPDGEGVEREDQFHVHLRLSLDVVIEMGLGDVVEYLGLGEAFTLFARIDEKAFLEEMEKRRIASLPKEEKVIEEPEHEPEIAIDAFGAIELRVAKIIAAEPVPKAKKLLKLQIDLGYEQIRVVSGIAKFYAPEDLIGRKIIVVANLKPATLCGIESQGMILASGEEQVRVVFLADDTPLGERIR
jgi:methionyl-tRNA synthetase